MGDLFQQLLNNYRKLDKKAGGWLPGGGTASPITAASQQAQRDYNEKIRRRIEMRDAPPGTPGRFAGEGQVMNALRATTSAGANPVGLAFANKKDVEKVASYYKARPELQNQYDLNTNMMLRYLSGTGAEGMQVSPEVGRQLYSDIQEQEKLFQNPEYRQYQITSPNNPAYMRENILRGNTPVYYGGLSDSPAPHQAQLPIDIGERWQLSKSLGSFWAQPQAGSQGRTINEKYDFGYAPESKGGLKGGAESAFILPTSAANVGRRLAQQGYGTPFAYSMDVQPSGKVTVYGR
jgi:hypothetical protein